MNDFDRHLAIQPVVFGQIDGCHSTSSNQFLDLVAPTDEPADEVSH